MKAGAEPPGGRSAVGNLAPFAWRHAVIGAIMAVAISTAVRLLWERQHWPASRNAGWAVFGIIMFSVTAWSRIRARPLVMVPFHMILLAVWIAVFHYWVDAA